MSPLTLHAGCFCCKGTKLMFEAWTWCFLVHAKHSCWCFCNSQQIFSTFLTSLSRSFSGMPASFVFPRCLIEFTPFELCDLVKGKHRRRRGQTGSLAYLPMLISPGLKASTARGLGEATFFALILQFVFTSCYLLGYLHCVGRLIPPSRFMVRW